MSHKQSKRVKKPAATPQHKQAATEPTPPLNTKPSTSKKKRRFSKFQQKVAGAIVFGLTVIGVIGWPSFVPRISVEPSENPARSNIFRPEFQMENQGAFSVHGVHCRLEMKRVLTESGGSFVNIGYQEDNRIIPRFEPGARTTLVLPRYLDIPSSATNADIDIVITYRPSFWPWVTKKTNSFSGVKRGDALAWFHIVREETRQPKPN